MQTPSLFSRVFHRFPPLLPLLALLPFSCAREVNESARSIEERILAARVQVKYLDTLHKTPSGMYYMIKAKGTGTPVDKENFVYVRYAYLDFNEDYLIESKRDPYDTYGTIEDVRSSEEAIAKQLGTYKKSTYYGPELWVAGVYALYEGIDEMLLDMREGDKRRIWLPSWLSSYGYGGPQNLTTVVYDIEVVKVIADIEQFQIDSLESYRDKYYPGIDSLSYGFYKKTLKEGAGDTLKTGNRVNYWYIGRLLDGFVFDTNIADSAKKYDIYEPRRTYEAMTGECREDGVFEDTVKGFSQAIFSMKNREEAVFFFYSGLGYGAGNSDTPRHLTFSPLVYYIKVERTDFIEEDKEDGEDAVGSAYPIK